MLELDQYLNWCDQKYSNTPHCKCGAACTNSNFCQGIQTNCYSCIKRVHDLRNKKVHYNCDKQALYYVLKHTYRFGAEVFFEINRLKRDVINWQDIYIASIGCGPCSELFGTLVFWRTLGKTDDSFHFRGFDTEQLWRPLMNQVRNCFIGMDVMPYNQDAFAFYGTSQERIDIVVLNYMLSDMRKFNGAQYQKFLADLIALIQRKHPRYLLLNDIYLRDSFDASKELISAVKRSGLVYKSARLQYHYYNPSIGLWGQLVPKQAYSMSNASLVSKYNPFPEVNSIQTIIKFQ